MKKLKFLLNFDDLFIIFESIEVLDTNMFFDN